MYVCVCVRACDSVSRYGNIMKWIYMFIYVEISQAVFRCQLIGGMFVFTCISYLRPRMLIIYCLLFSVVIWPWFGDISLESSCLNENIREFLCNINQRMVRLLFSLMASKYHIYVQKGQVKSNVILLIKLKTFSILLLCIGHSIVKARNLRYRLQYFRGLNASTSITNIKSNESMKLFDWILVQYRTTLALSTTMTLITKLYSNQNVE